MHNEEEIIQDNAMQWEVATLVKKFPVLLFNSLPVKFTWKSLKTNITFIGVLCSHQLFFQY